MRISARTCSSLLTGNLHLSIRRAAIFLLGYFTIARNKSLNWLRKKRPLNVSKLPERTDPRNPGDDLAQEEFFAVLDKRLQALPSKQKTAFVLAEFEELSYEQIAQIEGARIGTIKSRINRAKKKQGAGFVDHREDAI